MASASQIYLRKGTIKIGEDCEFDVYADQPAGYMYKLRIEFLDYSGYCTNHKDTTFTTSYGFFSITRDVVQYVNGTNSVSCKVILETYLLEDDWVPRTYIGSTYDTITLHVHEKSTVTCPDSAVTERVYITINSKSHYYTHDLYLVIKDHYIPIASDVKTTRYGFTLDYRLAARFRKERSIYAEILCITKYDTYEIGRDRCTFKLTVNDIQSVKPECYLTNIQPITDLEGEFKQIYIRGVTGLIAKYLYAHSSCSYVTEVVIYGKGFSKKYVFPSFPDYAPSGEDEPGTINQGSESSDIEVKGTILTSVSKSITLDPFIHDGNIEINCTVTDARGYKSTTTYTIYVYPYSRPKIVPYSGYSDIVCERAKATGELHSDGTYLAIMAGKRFTSIVKDGAELNSCRLRYRFKPTTVDTFGDWVTLLADGSAETEIKLLAGNVVSSTNVSYDIELSAIDLVGSEHVIRFSVMTSAISFVLYDGVDGAAFGKYPEEPHVVDIAAHMTLRVRGRLEVLGSNWESLELADGMSESPYAYGRQGDTGCYYQVSNGNHVQAAFNCSYDYAGRSMVVNKTPIPEEYRPDRTVCSICPTNDRRLALVTVQPDGYIRIEWVQTIASTSNTTSATVLWVDGYLDYWV